METENGQRANTTVWRNQAGFGDTAPAALPTGALTDSAYASRSQLLLMAADATIALPLLASALATTAPPLLARRKPPVFTLASRVMTIDGLTVPCDRFEEVNEPAV